MNAPVELDAARRSSVKKAIVECCEKRGWELIAVNVRTNHVHIVAAIGDKKPAMALNAFKANATRQMRTDRVWAPDRSPWADKGSERYLWTEKHVADAAWYVTSEQGGDLPTFA
jgi:REP element-mobilizing transposase RayT